MHSIYALQGIVKFETHIQKVCFEEFQIEGRMTRQGTKRLVVCRFVTRRNE